MLESLTVKNLALIEYAEIDFKKGLNILSGETGAGKSIIIGSISIALGGKVPKGIIRHNADSAYIELVFSITEDSVKKELEKMEVPLEEGQLIIARKLIKNRSICRLNGETVPASKIKEIASLIIDIHGQHEHQSLLYCAKHLEILDTFAKSQLQEWKVKNQQAYHDYIKWKKELEHYNIDEEQRRRELSFLEFELQEIEHAGLVPGEEEQLNVEYKRLVHGQQIVQGLEEIAALLGYEGNCSAGDAISQSVKIIQRVLEYDENLSSISNLLIDLEALVDDVNREVSFALDHLEIDEERLYEIQTRMDVIHSLKQKYGKTIEDILVYAEKKRKEYEMYLHFEEKKALVSKKFEQAKQQLIDIGRNITQIRTEAAKQLEQLMKRSLFDLNFLDVQFKIEIRPLDHFSINGMDQAEFLISTNPGEKIRPLKDVASGGELSRIMLAIKSVLAESDEDITLIFDEIDTGISGRTAQKVSEKLSLISKNHQVICISHLAQIVAMADHHFLIEKEAIDQITKTNIYELDREQIVQELARLLGGTEITKKTLDSAIEMKDLANRTKITK